MHGGCGLNIFRSFQEVLENSGIIIFLVGTWKRKDSGIESEDMDRETRGGDGLPGLV